MGEITMPAELMAAMNVFGGSGDMTSPLTEDNSQSGSFGAVLGLLMANSAQIQSVPEMTETETSPEMTAADILLAAVTGSEEAGLPEIFSENGAKVFIETVSRFLENGTADKLPDDLRSLWETVSPEERSAFAELLYAAADISEDDSGEQEMSPADIVRTICELAFKAAKKPAKDVSEKSELTDEAILIQGMTAMIRPVQTVSCDNIAEDALTGSQAVSRGETVNAGYPEANTAYPEAPVQTEQITADQALNTEKTPSADIQTAYEKLSEADPEELISFCRKLADELNASVSVSETAPEAAETGHVDYGRQGMQGFMARVNRHEELPSNNAEIIYAQAENKAAVTAETVIPFSEKASEDEEISSQIMRQIDLYKDIFQSSFSEKEISMKLSPESLGGVEIKIRRSDSGFEITFTAEKAEAAELIGNKASELADALASRGIALKEMSVTRQIVTNESDGQLTDGNLSGNGDLYGGANNGQNGSGRQFSFGGQAASALTSEQTDENASESNFNREAKLWVSA